VVPTIRGAAHLTHVIELAANLSTTLVVLCSQGTRAAHVVPLVERQPGATALLLDVPFGYAYEKIPTATSAPRFREAAANECGSTAAHRQSDLGLKRNLGLLLARLNGWRKILFLDDDIGRAAGSARLTPSLVRQIAAQLDIRQIAGLSCREFPDNSVVCHARKLAGLPQGNFVTGGAVGINCSDQPLPLFPEIYNEDWFFFSRRAAAREVACLGDVSQDAYDPYETPDRARKEEFGDLLAEGLYALFEEQPAEMAYEARLDAADESYWAAFKLARELTMHRTRLRLHSKLERNAASRHTEILAALESLAAAEKQLKRIPSKLCEDFVQCWLSDLTEWERAMPRVRAVRDLYEACERLSLEPVFASGPGERRRPRYIDLFMRSSDRPGALLSSCRSDPCVPKSNPSLR